MLSIRTSRRSSNATAALLVAFAASVIAFASSCFNCLGVDAISTSLQLKSRAKAQAQAHAQMRMQAHAGMEMQTQVKIDVGGEGSEAVQRTNKFAGFETGVEQNSLATARFIIVSAPSERKICYTQVEDINKWLMNRVFPLIDGGLILPMGLWYDKNRSTLFVADLDARKIIQYKIVGEVDPETLQKSLKTYGTPTIIVQDIDVRWLTVDQEGNIYYTDQTTSSINKITLELIMLLEQKLWWWSDLMTISEAQAAAEQEEYDKQVTLAGQPQPPQLPRKVIIQMFDKVSDPHVSRPNGIASHGHYLFWGNGAADKHVGSIAQGVSGVNKFGHNTQSESEWSSSEWLLDETPVGLRVENSTVLAANVNSAFGVTVTDNYVVYTDTGNVYAQKMNVMEGQIVKPLLIANSMQTPRGVVWDGDGTIYIADSWANGIYALPSSTKVPRVPEMVVGLHGAYGLTLVNGDDPGLQVLTKTPPSRDKEQKGFFQMLFR